MSFLYGQRHAIEHECAKKVAASLGAEEFRTIHIDLRAFGGSSLTSDTDVEKNGATTTVPFTYVPARNTVFLAYALAWAEVLGAESIFIGVNAVDYSGYPDCRPEYIEAFQRMADLATRAGIEGRGPKIETPLIGMSKAQIIAQGRSLGVDYAHTSSCYDPDPQGGPCGECESCRLRAKGFAELGVPDPVRT
jgi:7-cyano-7-deazaguanine synthase